MEERLYIINLYEYYGELLTLKQREYFEDYYFDNLSINEIADNDNVSKNAISKQLKIIKDKLNYYEDILNLYKNKAKINEIIKDIDPKLIDKINELI